LILGTLSGYAQNTASDELIAASEDACKCIASIESGAENKNDEIQKCIKGSLDAFKDGEDVKVDRFKQVESVLVQSCGPLKA